MLYMFFFHVFFFIEGVGVECHVWYSGLKLGDVWCGGGGGVGTTCVLSCGVLCFMITVVRVTVGCLWFVFCSR